MVDFKMLFPFQLFRTLTVRLTRMETRESGLSAHPPTPGTVNLPLQKLQKQKFLYQYLASYTCTFRWTDPRELSIYVILNFLNYPKPYQTAILVCFLFQGYIVFVIQKTPRYHLQRKLNIITASLHISFLAGGS